MHVCVCVMHTWVVAKKKDNDNKFSIKFARGGVVDPTPLILPFRHMHIEYFNGASVRLSIRIVTRMRCIYTIRDPYQMSNLLFFCSPYILPLGG